MKLAKLHGRRAYEIYDYNILFSSIQLGSAAVETRISSLGRRRRVEYVYFDLSRS